MRVFIFSRLHSSQRVILLAHDRAEAWRLLLENLGGQMEDWELLRSQLANRPGLVVVLVGEP